MGYIFSAIVSIVGDVVLGIMDIFANDFIANLVIGEATGSNNFGGIFDSYLPGVVTLKTIFKVIGITIIMLMMILNFVRAILPDTGKGDTQSPAITLGRGFLAVLLTAYSYSIMALFQKPMAYLFKLVMETEGGSSKLAAGATFGTVTMNKGKTFEIESFSSLMDNLFVSTSYDELTASIIVLLMLVVITWAFIKLLLEMVERYVVLGFLFYASPLAMSMVSSNSLHGIFTNYVRMVVSQYLIMLLNMMFLFVFFYAFTFQPLLTAKDATISSTLLYYAMMLAWLRLGRSLDEHLSSLGLSVAQTGAGLGAEIQGDLAAFSMVGRTAGALIGGATKPLSRILSKNSAASPRTAGAGPNGSFNVGNMERETADLLSKSKMVTGEGMVGKASTALGISEDKIKEASIGNGTISVKDSSDNQFDFQSAIHGGIPEGCMKASISQGGQEWVAPIPSKDSLSSPIVRSALNDAGVMDDIKRQYPAGTVVDGGGGYYKVTDPDGKQFEAFNTSVYSSSYEHAGSKTFGNQKIDIQPMGAGAIKMKDAYTRAHSDRFGIVETAPAMRNGQPVYSSHGVNDVIKQVRSNRVTPSNPRNEENTRS